MLRWFLTMGAGALVSRGYITGSGADEIISLGLGAGAMIWGLWFHAGPTKATVTNTLKTIAPDVAADIGVKVK